ncbi:uncharacterized protein LOC126682045 [Mercurialis annua]|uniref:uncharacterized protein LOC126682045 n=1 Tax=Mercurialis annua TaxID=3986 RepID=UPI002160F789|nr:uncharacterized protein LOC126682045 [Mercurialis annua]
MHVISSTKTLCKNLRDFGWNAFLVKVKTFCEDHKISVPDMEAQYTARRGRAHHQQNEIAVEHHYRIDIFLSTIDYQFSTLDSRDSFKSFKIDDICKLAEKFYPSDFTEQELLWLRIELQLFEIDISSHSKLRNSPNLQELCQGL